MSDAGPEPVVKMRILRDEAIPMDDGIELRANVYLPPDGEQFPVVLACTNYAKDLPFSQGYPDAWERVVEAAPDVARNSSMKYISFEAVDPEKWTPHGYAVVVVDARGIGRSPGVIDSFSLRESEDYFAAIEWAAVQEWSTGKVGTMGMSYLATAQWFVANLKPPHLAGMITWEGQDDNLRGLSYHGGIPGDFYRGWSATQVKSVQHGLGSRGFRNEFTGELVCGEVELPQEELDRNMKDIYVQVMEHPLDDDFYSARKANYDDIAVPLLSVGSWGAVGVHLRGNCEGFMCAASTEKWLVVRQSTGSFAAMYSDDGVELQRRFFDHVLKGEGDFAEAQPRVQLDIRSVADEVLERRAEGEWPLERTNWTRMYLDLDGSTLAEQPTGEQSATYRGFGEGLLLLTAPLEEELEITGPLAAKLWVSSSTIDADLFLVLRLFGPDGSEHFFHGLPDPKVPATNGWLRASQRTLDESKSRPYRPYLSHDNVRPLIPGEKYELDIEIWPTCLVIPAGYRLGLSIQGVDFDHGDPTPWGKSGYEMRGSSVWMHTDPLRRPAEIYDGDVTIHAGGGHQSYLLLPVIPKES
jgi:uncharacterized protein